jgi:KUP system potassium uptake protein
MKVLQGGWVPLDVAALVFFLMYTWWRGRRELLGVLERDTFPLRSFIARVNDETRGARYRHLCDQPD